MIKLHWDSNSDTEHWLMTEYDTRVASLIQEGTLWFLRTDNMHDSVLLADTLDEAKEEALQTLLDSIQGDIDYSTSIIEGIEAMQIAK